MATSYKTGAANVIKTFRRVPSNLNQLFNMSRYTVVLVAIVLAVLLVNNGADAQGRYYFSRNVMPTVVSYRPVMQRLPSINRNPYATAAYNPYAAAAPANNNNWARPLVSVPQQQPSYQPQYISRPNYYSNSAENNSGESREVYRRFW